MDKEPQINASWYKAKIVSEIALGLGALAIPFVIHLSTSSYTNSLKEREMSIRNREIGVHYVEVAIGILREDPTKQNTRELRRWAIDVINKNSPIPLSPTAINDLMERRLAPKSDGNSQASGGFGIAPFGESPWGK